MATHDYNIANQIGSEFRADLNNALLAIVSNNSNATSPSTTYAYQLWVDTANNVLKLRNSANSDWITTGISITASNSFTGDITGNSATATALATARTINGVSFDGTANISFNTDSVSEGSSNLYFTNERVDDQVNSLLTAGSGISLTYDDAAGTLTIANTNSADITSVVAGDGLTGGGTSGDVTLAVSVDDSSIEINSDTLRVKASGITNSMLAGSIANSKLANSSVTINSQAISLGGSHTFDSDDIGEGSSNLYFTNARARGSLSIGSEGSASGNGAIAYNSSTGVFTYTPPVISGLSGDTDDLSEGSSNLYYTDTRANSAIDARVTNTFINNLSGVVADTSTALATARSIALSGDVTASGVNFDGTGDITLSTTIAANSVALGTDTTGNYVATIAGTTNEIEVSGSGSETASVTIGLPDNVTIAGDLTVNGTTTTVNTSTLEVEDPLIKLAKANSGADSVDIGFYGLYDTSGSQDLYAGLFRDASDSGKFKLFKDLQAEPTTTVNTSGTGYAVGTLVSNLEGDVTGTLQTAAQPNITSLGTLSGLTVSGDAIFDTSTLKVDSSNNRIGIGTASPSFKLDLDTSSGSYQRITGSDQANVRLRFTNGGSGGKSYEIVGGLAGANNSAFSIFDVDNSATRLSIDSSGDVTIGGTLATTLSTAAQPNITSLGTLTTLTVDDITINGSTISDAANLTIDIGGELNIDVDGGAINYKDGGTHFGSIEKDGNNFRFESKISDGDIVFRGNDGGSGINALTLDMSNAGSATFNKDIFIGDGNPIRFGDDQDGRVFYDDTNGFIIQNSTSDKDILIKGNDGGSTITALTLDMSDAGKAIFTAGATFGNNVDITGTVTATELNVAEFQTSTNVFESNVSGHKGARLRAAVSDASTPTFSFHDDTNTGMYSSGADTLNFSTAGSEALRIDSSGNLLIGNTVSNPVSGFSDQAGFGYASSTGQVQIATTGDNEALQIGKNNSNDGKILTIRKQSTVIGSIGSEGGDSLFIQGGSSSGSGLLMHGTGAKVLPLQNSASVDATVDLGQSSRQFKNLYLSNAVYLNDIIAAGSGGLSLQTDEGTKRLVITDAGNIGIGTTDPQYKFDVYGEDDVTMRIHRPNSGLASTDSCGIGFSQRGDASTSSSDTRAGIFSNYNGDLFLAVESGGNLNSNPIDHSALFIEGGDGDVGIGTISPSTKLDVVGNIASTGVATPEIELVPTGSVGNADLKFDGTTFDIRSNSSSAALTLQTASTERMRILSGGNVGVNTSTPTYLFNVLASSGSQNIFQAGQSGVSNGLSITSDGSELTYSFLTGNVGIGVSSPDVPLHILTNDSTTNSTVTSLMITNLSTGTTTTGFGGEIRFQAERNNGVNQNTGGIRSIAEVNSGADISSGMAFDTGTAGVNSEKLRITHDGKVGIGTNSPDAELQIMNNDGSSYRFGYGGSSDVYLDADNVYFRTDNGGSNTVIISTSGVGIGTTSPDCELNIVDASTPTLRIKDTTNNCQLQLYAQNSDAHIGTSSNHNLIVDINDTEKARFHTDGHFLIGTTTNQGVGGLSFEKGGLGFTTHNNNNGASGGYEFYVFRRSSAQIGSIAQSSTNAVTYNTSSDARLKDVTGASRGLDVINKLNPVAYNWKSDNHADEGLIAQEVEELVPNAVNQNEDGYYQMDYSKLVTHLVKGMQEQQEQIESLKSEIANLKGE